MANAKHIPRWRDFQSALSRRGLTTASFLLLGATAAVFFALSGSYGLSENDNPPEVTPGLSADSRQDSRVHRRTLDDGFSDRR